MQAFCSATRSFLSVQHTV